ncbi:hypothetical protein ASPBRDRAFT_43604 [Aspergillus brasiliensis CBS 101740]|uniref:Uncharacterized protein n=1 Tax=Aspergillus brasiliensis (strain CBS 101740 / IMI 381727 / IBT 21946) TaxID=767769 RepID=A0A1L9UKL0_ASPBC|nr:hypothetical protein ASPBRDRAFT_43604 [Aspergillus brasiliensis CBS 101740]
MKVTLLASLTLLGLALATATDPTTDDIGSTKVTDGNLDVRALIAYILRCKSNHRCLQVNYCGERCEYDWECRRGNRCHECRKERHEVSVHML